MYTKEITFQESVVRKLLGAGSGDVALLYLYLQGGNDPEQAAVDLRMQKNSVDIALAALRQLGLWQVGEKTFIPGERPSYSERDVVTAMDHDRDFRALYEEIQRVMGRALNTEELKIILGFQRYLGLEPEVVCLLVRYCRDRMKSGRNPSFRSIEKEAYAWADMGIDTMEEASAFILRQQARQSRMGMLKKAMQIYDRELTPSEEKYATSWLEMGFDADAIAIAHDRTCVNAGGRNWAYTNRILVRWHEAGLHTPQEIQQRDQKPAQTPKGAVGQLGEAELENIRRLMQEDT